MAAKFEEALVAQCAPTLAGVKPGSLFRFAGEDTGTIEKWAAEWDRRLRSKGLRVTVLKTCPAAGACVIYVYRGKWVSGILSDAANVRFLQSLGYEPSCVEEMVAQLARRLCQAEGFAHEVGLFIGYPLRDVVGFIENRGKNYTCCGCYKCYGDPEEAQRHFACYRSCTAIYCRRYREGATIIELTVAA